MSGEWAIVLSDGATIVVAGAEITTRSDGSLWVLAADTPPPDKLKPVLILARGRWHAVHPAGANPLPPATPKPERIPRFA
jgi:hypothetical protein